MYEFLFISRTTGSCKVSIFKLLYPSIQKLLLLNIALILKFSIHCKFHQIRHNSPTTPPRTHY